jgi:hypothetical protein
VTTTVALIRLGWALLLGYGVLWMVRDEWRMDRREK